MKTLKTLLELAGAPTHPAAFPSSILIVIDAQLEYVTGKLPLAGIAAAVAETAALLDVARRRSVPVVHVVQHGKAGGSLFDPTTKFAAIVPEVAPMAREDIVVKTLPNAFAGTRLLEVLSPLQRKELILAGFMTHMCISATARVALDLGYRSTVVAAATATRDLPDPLGGWIPAATVQRASLAELADRFAIVVPDTAALERAA